LDAAEVSQEFIIQQFQTIADAQITLDKSQGLLCGKRIAGNSKLGTAGFLATEQVAHRLDGLQLEIEIGFEVEFHGYRLIPK
jgi:hypothetical protein